ncbi:MAG: pyridoxal-phosphate dependent enzyme [Desulfurococcales archaeon]|nr:pyridoxal-phosphate dependent enzyme [Desulfurococcales archaeon]
MKLVSILDAPKPSRRLTPLDIIDELGLIIERWEAPCVNANGEDYDRVYWSLWALGCKLIALGEGCKASLDELGVFRDFEDKPRNEVYSSVRDFARKAKPTPLVRLSWKPAKDVRVWAKLEWFNPLSLSLKDRPALHILEELGLPPGSYIGDASSSNFAAALASASRIFGYRARVYLPSTTGRIGRVASLIMGAEVVVKTASSTVDLIKLVKDDSQKLGFTHIDQFTNDLNFEAHIRGTARELDYQARSKGIRVSGLAGSLGTSGHMAAVAFYFSRRTRGDVDIVLAQPAKGSVIPGLRRVETGMLWINLLDVDYNIYDVTLEDALTVAVEVARSDGLLVSPSAGAAFAALRAHAENYGISGNYIVIVPDTGYKYLDLYESWVGGELA